MKHIRAIYDGQRVVLLEPVDLPPNTPVEVVVRDTAATEAKGWPAGFFEETFGSFSDEPLVRDEQGAYEIRDELA